MTTSATIGPPVCYVDDDAPLFCAAMARALAESATELTQVWQDVGARRVWVGVARDERAAGVRSSVLLNACPWCGRALQQQHICIGPADGSLPAPTVAIAGVHSARTDKDMGGGNRGWRANHLPALRHRQLSAHLAPAPECEFDGTFRRALLAPLELLSNNYGSLGVPDREFC